MLCCNTGLERLRNADTAGITYIYMPKCGLFTLCCFPFSVLKLRNTLGCLEHKCKCQCTIKQHHNTTLGYSNQNQNIQCTTILANMLLLLVNHQINLSNNIIGSLGAAQMLSSPMNHLNQLWVFPKVHKLRLIISLLLWKDLVMIHDCVWLA